MFPQTELENYKLQVELLQEKLHRSEISRQQLEHKLDKLLLKREEHDKLFRLKSKQKFQQFLEEQQKRNERNKQLVQMLERIEQQTSAMNARSERLKMMKLQYEMYFAKLVHSQTRRCLQTSAASVRPVGQTMPTAASIQGLHYTYMQGGEQPQFLENTNQNFTDNTIKTESFQQEPPREPINGQTPFLDYTLNSERSDYFDTRNPDSYQLQQQRYDPNMIRRDVDERKPQQVDVVPSAKGKAIFNTIADIKRNQVLPSEVLLNKNKEAFDMDIPTTLSSASTAYTLDRTPNSIKATTNLKSSLDHDTVNDDKNSVFELQSLREAPPISEKVADIRYENKANTNSPISGSSSNRVQDYDAGNVPEKNDNMELPQTILSATRDVNMKPASIYEPKAEPQSANANKKPVVSESSDVIENPTPPSSSSVAPPVSLENIENAIYGELLNPLDETNQKPQKPVLVGPEILENLVTQPLETSDSKTLNSEPANEYKEQIFTEANNTSYKDETSTKNIALPAVNTNYEQAYNYDTLPSDLYSGDDQSNVETNENINNVDYTGYEMNTKPLDADSQPQQYDYTNYDPSQYSYPGYIYDETTGEYKPDPNAPADQYATDQQYAQGYEQYQQDGYDYNQSYGQQEAQQSSEIDTTAYANYEAAQQLEQTSVSETSENKEEAIPTKQLENPEPQATVTEENLNVTDTQASPADTAETTAKTTKPTSILSTAEKNDQQKKKKRVNFVDSSETDTSSVDKGGNQSGAKKPTPTGNESDFDFSSGSEAAAKTTPNK